MGRWILTLLTSLLAALPFFRRRAAARAAGGSPRPAFLPPAEGAKLAPIWEGFGDDVAALFGEVDVSEAQGARAPTTDPERAKPRSAFVAAAAVAPWLLVVAGAASFLVDAAWPARRYLFLGAVSGLVGFWTNRLAIVLLFKPVRPRFGFGVIPANRQALIRRLAGAIEARLVNPESLAAWLHQRGLVRETLERWHDAASRVLGSEAFRADLKKRLGETGRLFLDDDRFRKAATEKVVGAVRDLLRRKVWKWVAELVEAPVAERVAAELRNGLRTHGGEMLDELMTRLDGALDALAARLKETLPELEQAASESIVAGLRRLDLRGLVESKLRDLDDGELESLLRAAVRNELAAVE
ncbi:MAG TPA: DUF445 family protein, partial [Planctomycetota bacterium]|nr:DUF445 family protein [Planctomycetota bacterium]